MTNILSFSDHLDINEMLNASFTEEEMDNLDKITKEIFLSENYEEAYALYEGERWQKFKDAFKRNPDESTFKKILKYIAGAALIGTGARIGGAAGGAAIGKVAKAGAVTGAKAGIAIGNIIGLFGYLAIALYRRNTDICDSKKSSPVNWWRCQKDAAEKTKASLKSNYADALAILSKGENNEKQILKLKEKMDSKNEYLDEKIAKCDLKIKQLS
jgi:hypothetical protein